MQMCKCADMQMFLWVNIFNNYNMLKFICTFAHLHIRTLNRFFNLVMVAFIIASRYQLRYKPCQK